MAEQQAPKAGPLRRWRERWLARRDRAREIERRQKQRREAERRDPRGPAGGGGGIGFGP
jgi:hypothetical protein